MEFSFDDYLGRAAQKKYMAREAIRQQEFDLAWKLFHEQKDLLMQHANREEWEPKYVYQLDGSVSQDLANILRLEGKHTQALVHIIYWVATSLRATQAETRKVGTYFRRARLKNATIEDVEDLIERNRIHPDFRAIQSQVQGWAGV